MPFGSSSLSSGSASSPRFVSGGMSALQIEVAKTHFPAFIRGAWSIVEPTTPFSWNWHHEAMAEVLTDIKNQKLKRVIFNIPPGCSKSLQNSVFFNAWLWTSDPSLRFLTSSYSDANTIRDNRRVRSIVTSPWFKESFWSKDKQTGKGIDCDLSIDQAGKIRFDTTATGWRIATSVGGVGTGEHPNYIILDDLIKAGDRESEAKLQEAQDYISSTVSTRGALTPSVILVMQRLNELDPTGFLLNADPYGWEHVLLPMRYSSSMVGYTCQCHKDKPDKRDERQIEGELLWPSVWDEEKVKQEELLLGEFGTAGQLQQRPVPEGGALFKREWFEIIDFAPNIYLAETRGWDIAESDDKGDFTVGVKMRKTKEGVYYIMDAIEAQRTMVDGLILNTTRIDGKKCRVREGAGSGKATLKARAILLDGYDFASMPETDSKTERANPFRAQCQAGNVKLVRGDWNEKLLQVTCSFPFGKYDDYVDAEANAYNDLVEFKQEASLTWGVRRAGAGMGSGGANGIRGGVQAGQAFQRRSRIRH